MLLYAALFAQSGPADRTSIERRLIVEVIASLAGWDSEVCELLAALPRESLLQPLDALTKLAHQRGWLRGTDSYSHCTWQVGMLDVMEGESVLSAAAVALQGDLRELDRRIWSGQVAAVLPWLEERRKALIERYRSRVCIPWQRLYGGTVTDPSDLEFGDLCRQISQGLLSVTAEESRHLWALREIRNELAHFSRLGTDGIERLLDALREAARMKASAG
jgi:hypothetical protein